MPHVFVPVKHRSCSEGAGSGRTEPGGRSNFMMTVVTSFGFILTVSFQPLSLGSGGRDGPLRFSPTLGLKDSRFRIWTLTGGSESGAYHPWH